MTQNPGTWHVLSLGSTKSVTDHSSRFLGPWSLPFPVSLSSLNSDAPLQPTLARLYHSTHLWPLLTTAFQSPIRICFLNSSKPKRIRNGVMGIQANGFNGNTSSLKFLIYGRTGWIGGFLGRLCEERHIPFAYGLGRLENRSQLIADIKSTNPTHVFNAAGVTGRPNVDWCESHKVETIRANVAGTLTLADVCREEGLILVNYATGCIFEYDDLHRLGSGIGFREEDMPNFVGSFYSKTKAMVCNLYLYLFQYLSLFYEIWWVLIWFGE